MNNNKQCFIDANTAREISDSVFEVREEIAAIMSMIFETIKSTASIGRYEIDIKFQGETTSAVANTVTVGSYPSKKDIIFNRVTTILENNGYKLTYISQTSDCTYIAVNWYKI